MTPYQLLLGALQARGVAPRNTHPHKAEILRQCRCDCPSCGGHSLPLEIAETRDAAVLLHCHAGCSFDAVVQALGLQASDLFPQRDPVRERAAGSQSPIQHWTSAMAAADAALALADHAYAGDREALGAQRSELIRLRTEIKAALRADVAVVCTTGRGARQC